jgi:hypothetical protein
MTASIDYSAFTTAIKRLDAASAKLQKELVANLHQAGPRIEADMQGAAHTRIQQRAASTINVTRDAQGISVIGGGSGGLGGQLFAGGEFGGRKSKRKAYATRSPNGTAYVVRRRTTMQFLPHLGQEGYFYWPTIRDWLPNLYKQQQKTLARVMGGKG